MFQMDGTGSVVHFGDGDPTRRRDGSEELVHLLLGLPNKKVNTSALSVKRKYSRQSAVTASKFTQVMQ